MSKPYCPDCGEPMRESDESDAHFHAGAFICVACGYDSDTPPDTDDRQIEPMYDNSDDRTS